MSTPCYCGASKTFKGCPPCFVARRREQQKASYWRNAAPYRSRQKGRPRKDEVRIAANNTTAVRMLQIPLRAGA